MLRRTHRTKAHDLGFGKYFLDVTPKAQVTKENIENFDFTKIFKMYASKDSIPRVKRHPTE